MLPFSAHARSDPDEFCTAGLNRVDGVDVIHVKRIGVRFEIDGPFRATAQMPQQNQRAAKPILDRPRKCLIAAATY